MIGRLRRRYGYALAVMSLLACIVAAGAFIIVVALPEMARTSAAPPASPASPASPSPSPIAPFMAWLSLPADADCAACHLTDKGAIGLRAVPAMAHPLTGWTNCTACHASDRLVETAPGHTGLHSTDCLRCHQPQQLPAPLSRPHRELQNQACLDCHGQTEPLPSDMAHRPEMVCWLCHRVPQDQPPMPVHQVSAGQSDCLRCHVAGVDGALPADHATRDASECLLCHAPPPSGATQSRTVRYPLAIERFALPFARTD